MSQITVQTTREDAASRSLQVTVPPERVRAAEDRAVRQYARHARLPGFRPGKAPEAVVRKRYGEAIRQSVLEEVIRESWRQAVADTSLKPIGEPHIHNLKFTEGGPIEFEFHVEVRPEVKLERTGGFVVRREVAPVTDEQVAETLERLREQKAAWLPVEGERPAPGQMVVVEVAPIEEGERRPAQPYSLVLGQGQALPELEERIMTLLPGESTETEVRYPDDHPDESKRGQSRRVHLALHEVKRQELPPLDDAFAREVGDFESLEALRAAVRADLERDAAREADARVREALLDQLIEANGVEAPETWLERYLRSYAQLYQVDDERFAAFAAQFRPVAERQVRRDLVLAAVIEAQGLQATEAEVDERVAAIARARDLPVNQVYASLQKSNRLRELERAITEEKAFAHLLQQSTVEEVAS
ncbi:MAG TPA: trigger factor [Gemmatimonadales bacterium]|nr:trigger factor [Gemmatimonadales bacterium]